MVLGQQFSLHLEQAFRVTQVAHQIAGNLRQLVVLAGEDLLPCLDHRIGLIPHVQVHGTVIRIDGGLHGVANVVGVLRSQLTHRGRRFRSGILGGFAQIGHLRIRVGVRRGVAIDDPLDTTIHDRRVHTAVKRQVWRDLGHTLLRGTIIENLRFGVHTVREQNLVGAETDGIQQSGEDITDLRAAIATERVGGAFGTGRVIELPRLRTFRSAHDRIFGSVRREVDTRLVLFGFGELALGWNTRLEELRLAVGRHLVAVGGHHTIAVRVHGMVVDPVTIVKTGKVKFSCCDHRILAHTVDLIFVDGKSIGKRVILLGLLQLLECRGNDLRIEQSDLRGRFRGISQRTSLAFRSGLILFGLHIVQTVCFTGGVDITLDIGRFHFLRVRIHTETLQQHRPCHGKHQAHHNGGCDGHGRHLPRFKRFGSTHRNRSLAFQRMRLHDPHAENHTENDGDGSHDEGDGNRGVDRGIRGTGDAATLLREVGEHAKHLIRRPCEHVEHQPDADLSTRTLGDVEQSTTMHWHGDSDAAHHHMRDDGEDDAGKQQQRHCRHDQLQARQYEHIETIVDAELRVGGAETLRVEHQQDFRPIRIKLRSEHQADDQ